MNTVEIRQCLEQLQVDEGLIDHFISLLSVLRAKASNGHRLAVERLQELLNEAINIGAESVSYEYDCPVPVQSKTAALAQALEVQICKARASLKK